MRPIAPGKVLNCFIGDHLKGLLDEVLERLLVEVHCVDKEELVEVVLGD